METRNLIGGEWVTADSGEQIDVYNPATDALLGAVPKAGAGETARAIGAAHDAWEGWRSRTGAERGGLVRQLAEAMRRDRERLAALMTAEQGKPLAEAAGEINYAASFFDFAAGEAERIYGDTIPASAPDKRILAIRQPVGVCAIVTPWNFPAAMITRKLGPALAAGCTAVIKPASATPLSALAIGELAVEAGIPAGVINIVTGSSREISSAIFADRRVRKLSFTGSTEVGRQLMRQASDNLLRLSLELGGHAPLIVFDDADVDVAVKGAIASKFRNAGQTCICANRFFVQEGIYDEFVARFEQAVAALRVGDGMAEGAQIGPLIDDDAIEKVERHVADAREKGARLRIGGRRIRIDGLADRFYAPTVLEDVTADMLCFQEETFGPVAPLRRFTTEDEAVELANDSPYGLASYFFTRDASRLMRVAERLEYGIVGANDGAPSTAQAPFGGVKQSGFGREGGKYVMDEYTEIKYISWKL
ncbi:MAG: NAD-dependent succinate-semialdehyde dehydrogenase [Phycisphaerales bacterium JB039]